MFAERRKEIQEIIADLEGLRTDSRYQKAVEINLDFFQAARSPLTYIWWLVTKAPNLRKKREEILELGDLPLPKWQRETHLRLLRLERLAFPGLLQPLKRAIREEIDRLEAVKKEPLLLLGFGSGAMELERQLIEELLVANLPTPVIFLGVELSPHILETALSNLSSLAAGGLVKIERIESFDSSILEKLKSEKGLSKITVAVINTHALDLRPTLPPQAVDLVYHSRLKHHLTAEERDRLDELSIYLAPKILEFDDFCSVPVFIFPSIITWRYPVTLNGSILSYLRDPSKREVRERQKPGWRVKFYQLGYYLKSYGN